MTQATPAQADTSKVVYGALLVWAAVIIYASSNSIVSALAEIGWQNKIDGRNAISFCNILFLGSLISLVPMLFMFRKDWTRNNIRS
ncbi:MAG: EamA family transporter, partial [Bacteroidota bacterium]